jgi:hypothetical protein
MFQALIIHQIYWQKMVDIFKIIDKIKKQTASFAPSISLFPYSTHSSIAFASHKYLHTRSSSGECEWRPLSSAADQKVDRKG